MDALIVFCIGLYFLYTKRDIIAEENIDIPEKDGFMFEEEPHAFEEYVHLLLHK